MKIYNEEINDLLAVENQRLQVHEHVERGVFVAGLTEEIVSDAEQILKLIDSGEVNRHFGETNMNVHSSATIDEYGSSKKIHEHEERKSDEKSEKIAEEETMDDKEAKEGNRAWAVLREVQTKIGKEVACNHVQKVGFSTDGFATTLTMRKLHLIWVTARMHIEIYKYPAWSDVVEIETWCQSEGRIGTRRDWILKDCSTGEVIGRATSKWVMMNQDTRRLQRVTDEVRDEYLVFCPREPRLAFPEENNSSLKKIPKLEDPAQYSMLGLKPRRADLDMNQHVNNVTYIGWVLESIPQEIIDTHELKVITLDYRRECQQDDIVDSLTTSETPDEAVSKLTGTNGSTTSSKKGHNESQFLHILRLSENGQEINRGRTQWRKKSSR